MRVVIVGARNRSSINSQVAAYSDEEKQKILEKDRFLVEGYIKKLHQRYKRISVVSYGCDDGVSLLAKNYCINEKIKFAEIAWFFHGDAQWDRSETQELYLARHGSFIEIADLFIIFAKNDRYALVENLIERLTTLSTQDTSQGQARPFIVINEEGKIITGYKQESILG